MSKSSKTIISEEIFSIHILFGFWQRNGHMHEINTVL